MARRRIRRMAMMWSVPERGVVRLGARGGVCVFVG